MGDERDEGPSQGSKRGESAGARAGRSGGGAGTRPAKGKAARGRSSGESQGFAVGADGTPIYYRLNGSLGGTALPVAFVDGIGCDGYVWKYLEPELTRTRPIVHFNYRGHGRTPLPRDPNQITISDCADDLVAVLDAANDNVARHHDAPSPAGRRNESPSPAAAAPEPFDRVFLAGHSMGVQVCLETWRRHPERVAGLVLLCGSYGTPLRTFKNSRALEDLLPVIRLGVHAMPRAVGAFMRTALPTQFAYRLATLFEVNGALIRPEDFTPYLAHMAQVDMRLFVDMLAAAGRHTTREILADVDVPVLIVAGDQDGFTPLSLSEEMHKLIPGSELFVVRGGSHTAPIEKPEEVTGAIVEFLARAGEADRAEACAADAADSSGAGPA